MLQVKDTPKSTFPAARSLTSAQHERSTPATSPHYKIPRTRTTQMTKLPPLPQPQPAFASIKLSPVATSPDAQTRTRRGALVASSDWPLCLLILLPVLRPRFSRSGVPCSLDSKFLIFSRHNPVPSSSCPCSS